MKNQDLKARPPPTAVAPGRRRVLGERLPRGARHAKRAAPGFSVAFAPRGHTSEPAGACVFCFGVCMRCLFTNPDVRISKTARSQVIRDWS